MKTVIAGSRILSDYGLVEKAVKESGFDVTEVISGGASGIDRLGEAYARNHGIPYKIFKAPWERFGRKAGILRNEEMAKSADAVIVIWDGKSRGSSSMIQIAKNRLLPLFVLEVDIKTDEG